MVGIRCVHYIEQKDSRAGLHTRGLWQIPYTKVNQVDASFTGRTVQGRDPRYTYSVVASLAVKPVLRNSLTVSVFSSVRAHRTKACSTSPPVISLVRPNRVSWLLQEISYRATRRLKVISARYWPHVCNCACVVQGSVQFRPHAEKHLRSAHF